MQLQDNDLREIEIGKKIQEIIQYETFYAPILNTCPIEIGLIDENEINKCDVVRKNQDSNSKEVVFMSSTFMEPRSSFFEVSCFSFEIFNELCFNFFACVVFFDVFIFFYIGFKILGLVDVF